MENIKQIGLDEFNDLFNERMQDPQIVTRLLELTGGELPFSGNQVPSAPFMPLSPYLAYPGFGLTYAAGLAASNGVDTVIETYKDDSFTYTNPEKSDMARPVILLPNNQIIRPKITTPIYTGGAIGRIATIYEGVDMEEFYRRLCNLEIPGVRIIDMSNFYLNQTMRVNPSAKKADARAYYLPAMAISQVCGVGVNAPGNEDEGFYERVVYGAVINAARILGVEPVSVKMPTDLPTPEKRFVGHLAKGKWPRAIDCRKYGSMDSLEKILALNRKELINV